MMNFTRRPKREISQVKGCEYGLVISNRGRQGSIEKISMAKKLSEHGVNVLLTHKYWPRDELIFYDDGKFDFHPTSEVDPEDEPLLEHEAYHGGKILKGPDFIIASDSVFKSKREQTIKAFNAKKGYFLTLDDSFADMQKQKPCRNKTFYSGGSAKHIDMLINIGNTKKIIFTFDSKPLLEIIKDVAGEISYDIALFPRDEAIYYPMGFVELGDHVLIDRRAKKSAGLLEDIGYHIIRTPHQMIFTNLNGGSIRCTCTEIPNKIYNHITFVSEKEGELIYPKFTNLEGKIAVLHQDPIFKSDAYLVNPESDSIKTQKVS